MLIHTHTHTHTYIYIYVYIYPPSNTYLHTNQLKIEDYCHQIRYSLIGIKNCYIASYLNYNHHQFYLLTFLKQINYIFLKRSNILLCLSSIFSLNLCLLKSREIPAKFQNEKSELLPLRSTCLHGAQTEDNYHSRLADIYLSVDGKTIARS